MTIPLVIRSTGGALEAAVAAHMDGGHVAKVRYIDYEVDAAMDAFNKRREFAAELEVRAAFYDFGQLNALQQGASRAALPRGQSVVVELADLVLEVRTAPRSPAWFVEAVQDLVSRYELNVVVRPSELDALPPR